MKKIIFVFLFILVSLLVLPFVSCAVIFSADFETGNLSQWDGTNGAGGVIGANSNSPISGVYDCKASYTGAGGSDGNAKVCTKWGIDGFGNNFHVTFDFKVDYTAFPTNGRLEFLNLFNSGSWCAAGLTYDGSDFHWFMREHIYEVTDSINHTSIVDFSLSQSMVYDVDVYVSFATSQYSLYVDDVLQFNVINFHSLDGMTSNEYAEVQCGTYTVSYASTVNFYFDNFVMDEVVSPDPTASPSPSPSPSSAVTQNIVPSSPFTPVPSYYMVLLVLFAVVAVLAGLYVTFEREQSNKGVALLFVLVGLVVFVVLIVGYFVGF